MTNGITRRDFIKHGATLVAGMSVLNTLAFNDNSAAAGLHTDATQPSSAAKPPNILFIMSDDHAAHAISCYGSKINSTPNIDRIANEGMRFDNCFCTNSICVPSRASILTGAYSHVNGVYTLRDNMARWQLTYPQLLQKAGYETAVIGKWHLGNGSPYDPAGFDYWNILPGQGAYNNPTMIKLGKSIKHKGHVTDVITDDCLAWLKQRNGNKPFCLLCHHKAAHRAWVPAARHQNLYNDVEIPMPETFNDDYSNRASVAAGTTITIAKDIDQGDVKQPIPSGLSDLELKKWKYQRFIKDYLRCVAGIDESVGKLLNYLDTAGLAENTIVIYTSDQGFFLGDHGWFDKRFMYEESLRMPFIARFPREIAAGTVCSPMALNVDFAPTFLDLAGVSAPDRMQGVSLLPLMRSKAPERWRDSMYYRYYMDDPAVHIAPHYGVRTNRYKLIYYYGTNPSEWELFDLEKDPYEMNSVYYDPAYVEVVSQLKAELQQLRQKLGDNANPF